MFFIFYILSIIIIYAVGIYFVRIGILPNKEIDSDMIGIYACTSVVPYFNILLCLLVIIYFVMITFIIKKGKDMSIFKSNNSNNTIDQALNKKKQVEELEKKLEQEKQDMFKLKGKAKEDLQWILSE